MNMLATSRSRHTHRTDRGKRPMAAALVLALAVTGCTTTNPFTREEEVNKTSKGVGIGALAGLTTAILIGGNRKKLLLGAGIGALIGGSVGYYMDREEDKLRARLQKTGVSVTRSGDNIILNMPGHVTFTTNSSDISASFYEVLGSVALVLNEFDQTYIDVVGHTDSTGTAEHNQRLSEARANSVSSYLSSQGVLAQRMVATGQGQNSPIARNDTPDGRSRNRRVEIVLTPVT